MTFRGRIENGVTIITDIYEPAPLPPSYGRTRAPMTTRFFALLCVLAVIGGTLWAASH